MKFNQTLTPSYKGRITHDECYQNVFRLLTVHSWQDLASDHYISVKGREVWGGGEKVEVAVEVWRWRGVEVDNTCPQVPLLEPMVLDDIDIILCVALFVGEELLARTVDPRLVRAEGPKMPEGCSM